MNPYADQLTFTADRTRTRRDHEKYLTLIESVTLLHQHQRPLEQDEEAGLSRPKPHPDRQRPQPTRRQRSVRHPRSRLARTPLRHRHPAQRTRPT